MEREQQQLHHTPEGSRRTSLPALQSLEVAGNAGECFCPRWGALAPCCWMVGGTPADAPANAVVTGRPPLMPLGLGPSGLSPPACPLRLVAASLGGCSAAAATLSLRDG